VLCNIPDIVVGLCDGAVGDVAPFAIEISHAYNKRSEYLAIAEVGCPDAGRLEVGGKGVGLHAQVTELLDF
jgi:hypothetical protein